MLLLLSIPPLSLPSVADDWCWWFSRKREATSRSLGGCNGRLARLSTMHEQCRTLSLSCRSQKIEGRRERDIEWHRTTKPCIQPEACITLSAMLHTARLVRVTRASIQISVVQAQQHQRGELHPRRDQRALLRADPFVGKGNRARVNPPRPPPTCSKRTL